MSDAVSRMFTEPPVFLAPLAGISDLPFRTLALAHGASRVVSEMVASAGVLCAAPSARTRAELGLDEARTSVQLAGREPGAMAEAARMLEGQGAQVVDVNMGCPARKVTGGLAGAALMRDLDRASAILDAVVGACGVPVTLKMRLGWDAGSLDAPALAARAEAAGVRMIVVHGRTRAQFYDGRADWAAVASVKRATALPVVVNGDVVDAASARAALAASGADGVMVGRGARGRPWIVGRIAAELRGETPAPSPGGAALRDLIAGHYDAMLAFYGADLGLRVARKHLGWYLAALPGADGLRARLLRMTDPRAVAAALDEVADLAPPLEEAA